MSRFKKWFSKKKSAKKEIPNPLQEDTASTPQDKFIIVDNQSRFKIIRPLTAQQKKSIEQSTLLLRSSQLYMHYWTKGLVCKDRNDPEWQNKVMYFWEAQEPFPKKSLPPKFKTFQKKYFIFHGDTSKIKLQTAKAMPWFGMPGEGKKHVCTLDSKNISIPEFNQLGLVKYLTQVDLTLNNLPVLQDRQSYFFLVDQRITSFQNGHFTLRGKKIPITVAYQIGGIHLMKEGEAPQ